MTVMTNQEIREAITSEFKIEEAIGRDEARQPALLDEYEERLVLGLAEAMAN